MERERTNRKSEGEIWNEGEIEIVRSGYATSA
jgi:hypothetical protein